MFFSSPEPSSFERACPRIAQWSTCCEGVKGTCPYKTPFSLCNFLFLPMGWFSFLSFDLFSLESWTKHIVYAIRTDWGDLSRSGWNDTSAIAIAIAIASSRHRYFCAYTTIVEFQNLRNISVKNMIIYLISSLFQLKVIDNLKHVAM